MEDTAVKMAEAGCQFVTVLGVDYMSENVCATLDQAVFRKVGVCRMSNVQIGCTLADAAANPAYMSFLKAVAMSPPRLQLYQQLLLLLLMSCKQFYRQMLLPLSFFLVQYLNIFSKSIQLHQLETLCKLSGFLSSANACWVSCQGFTHSKFKYTVPA